MDTIQLVLFFPSKEHARKSTICACTYTWELRVFDGHFVSSLIYICVYMGIFLYLEINPKENQYLCHPCTQFA